MIAIVPIADCSYKFQVEKPQSQVARIDIVIVVTSEAEIQLRAKLRPSERLKGQISVMFAGKH